MNGVKIKHLIGIKLLPKPYSVQNLIYIKSLKTGCLYHIIVW